MDDKNLETIVFAAIDEISDGLDKGTQLPKSPDLVLAGDSGLLSSLQIVTLIANIEDSIEDAYGERLSLLENLEDVFEQDSNLTVSLLIRYIVKKL